MVKTPHPDPKPARALVPMPEAMPRKVPAVYVKKWRVWRFWQQFFAWLHLVIGSLSIICSSLVAANAANAFLPAWLAVTLATATAVFAFILAFVNAQQKNEAFELAARELEKAMARYEGDPSVQLKAMVDAQVRGIDILNQRDSMKRAGTAPEGSAGKTA